MNANENMHRHELFLPGKDGGMVNDTGGWWGSAAQYFAGTSTRLHYMRLSLGATAPFLLACLLTRYPGANRNDNQL